MTGAELIARARAAGRDVLTEPEAKHLIGEFGLPVPPGIVVSSEADLEAAADLNYPLALKVISPTLAHKSDVGAVRLGLDDRASVVQAMRETAHLPGRTGWLLEQMATSGLELMVGGLRHPRFGPMLMVGLGGVLVEYLDDVSIRICPITEADAHAMLNELRSAALLDGVRGKPGVDRHAVAWTLMQIGGEGGLLMQHADTLAELDINPLIAHACGVCAVDASCVLSPALTEPAPEAIDDLRPLLQPRTVAVAGASTRGTAQANQYLRNLRAYGFAGRIYAIHPSASEIDGIPAFPRLSDLPEPVDYAYIAVAAQRCPDLLAEADGKVRFAQVMSGGFGEGNSDVARETELTAAAHRGGVRVLGPNCMGTHSPGGKLTYMSGVDPRPGHIAIIAQSGGLSTDILRRGARRGIRFRGLVTVGNCADIGPAELSGAFLADDDTHVLGMYIEDPRRGRHLFETLRAHAGRKPVVLLVGGVTAQGRRAAQSHTGALAADARAWRALCAQTGAVLTESLDEFLDVLLTMQLLAARRRPRTKEVVLFGNGGGTSVLAADAFARAGFSICALPDGTRAALEALDLPVGASTANPIDVPANVLARENGEIAQRIAAGVFENARPDAFVIHMNVPVILGYEHADILGHLMHATLRYCAPEGSGPHALLVLRSDGEPAIEALKEDMRSRALEAGIPTFNELTEAARALAGLASYEGAAARLTAT